MYWFNYGVCFIIYFDWKRLNLLHSVWEIMRLIFFLIQTQRTRSPYEVFISNKIWEIDTSLDTSQ